MICTNEKHWKRVGIIRFEGLVPLGGSLVGHCRNVLREGAGSSSQGRALPRKSSALDFTFLQQHCLCSGMFWCSFLLVLSQSWHCLTWVTCFSLFIFLFLQAEVEAGLCWVTVGFAFQICSSSCWFPAAAGLWEQGWKRRKEITGEWENLIFEESGSWEYVCFPPTPAFYKPAPVHSDFPVFSCSYLSAFNQEILCILSFMRPFLVKWQQWFGDFTQLPHQFIWWW